jgi:pSer/pThr/pTyr-binding forkhead associated (FHA) protein
MPGRLEFSFNANKIDEYFLDKEVMTIGRKTDNDICIGNLAVSGYHAKLLTIFEDSFLEDLNSTNGTLVNGNNIEKHALRNGDIITIGKHELRFINEQVKDESDFEKTVFIRRTPKDSEKPGSASTEFKPPTPVAAIADNIGSAALQILSGTNTGKEFPLTKPSVKLGNSGKQFMQINRRPSGHFIVSLVEPGDDISLKVNGKSIEDQAIQLQNLDIIEINKLKVKYHLAS